MIEICRITLELPSQVTRETDITTDMAPAEYRNQLKAELLKYGIEAEIVLSYRDIDEKL
jgi:hypothetical protein